MLSEYLGNLEFCLQICCLRVILERSNGNDFGSLSRYNADCTLSYPAAVIRASCVCCSSSN